MIRSLQLELHARAKELFERENPGRLWRAPVGTPVDSPVAQAAAGLTERRDILIRVRTQMRVESTKLVAEKESLS